MNTTIRDKIHLAIEVGYRTRIPILFLSNPGLGKTTDVDMWSTLKDYKVIDIIGSQKVREEIVGYQVYNNGKESLLNPDWFEECWKWHKKGFKTVLHIDELSCCPEDVQGSLLQLIMKRKIAGIDNYLPDDTLIISSANYKGNLPQQMNIMPATLNRFIIVNIEAKSTDDLVDEFIFGIDENNYLSFEDITLTKEMKKTIANNLSLMLKKLFVAFSAKDTNGENYISVKHKNFVDLYDTDGDVYNFISGRTISFLHRMTQALYTMGIHKRISEDNVIASNVVNMVWGLIGAGTCCFNKQTQRKYCHTIMNRYIDLLNEFAGNAVIEHKKIELDYTDMTVGEAIENWMLYYDNIDNDRFDDNFIKLDEIITKEYFIDVPQKMIDKVENWEKDSSLIELFAADMQKFHAFLVFIEGLDNPKISEEIKKYNKIKEVWNGYYLQTLKM